MCARQFSLDEIIENVGGVEILAGYLEMESAVLETALAAPEGNRTTHVRAMVAENTQKLLLMPSQGGRIWRVTRNRVVKDWLILARCSEANGGRASVDESATDPGFQSHLDSLIDRANELWESPANPLMRESDGSQGELERALSKYVSRKASLALLSDDLEVLEPDHELMTHELLVLMRIAAGGYLWRAAEREVTPEAPLPPAANTAISWMSDHPPLGGNDRVTRLLQAIFWALSSYDTLALATDGAVTNSEAALNHGFWSIAEWACDQEGVAPTNIPVGEEGMRNAFNAGVVLREVEHYIE